MRRAGNSGGSPAYTSSHLHANRNPLSSTDAHRQKRGTAAEAAQLVERLDRQDAAGRANRVAEGNAGPVRVDVVEPLAEFRILARHASTWAANASFSSMIL